MSIACMPEVAEEVEVAGRDLVVLVLGHRQTEEVDGGAGQLPLVGGGDVGEQHAGHRAGDPDDQEEVLVDGDHADGAAVTGEAAQGVGERVDVAEDVVGELLDLPDALLAVGGHGEVDSVLLLGHDILRSPVARRDVVQSDRQGAVGPSPESRCRITVGSGGAALLH